MPRITAAEAKALAGGNLDDKVDAICDTIRTLATANQRICRAPGDHAADVNLWNDNLNPNWSRARDMLTTLGFDVKFNSATSKTVINW